MNQEEKTAWRYKDFYNLKNKQKAHRTLVKQKAYFKKTQEHQ